MACWWPVVWVTSTADWPSSAPWWAMPASSNARPFSEAAACLQSVPEPIFKYLVRNVTLKRVFHLYLRNRLSFVISFTFEADGVLITPGTTVVSHQFTPFISMRNAVLIICTSLTDIHDVTDHTYGCKITYIKEMRSFISANVKQVKQVLSHIYVLHHLNAY